MTDRSWYKVQLTEDVAGARRQIEIQNEFEQLYLAELGPRDVAMYSTGLIGDANGFCAYFSPPTAAFERFAAFLQRIGAEPCARPTDVNAFLVGHTATMRELLGYLPGWGLAESDRPSSAGRVPQKP
jgi:broad specificity phosphatase PhoE